MIISRATIFLLFLCASPVIFAARIGLLVVATGKYIDFVEPLISSADRYFCPAHDITYFIFTDGEVPKRNDVVKIDQHRLGWPYDTLMRCGMYATHKNAFMEMDYLFACDSDMKFVDFVRDEILSDRVATQHPGFVGKRGTYETSSYSTACIHPYEAKHYFAGGFHGGSRDEFIKLATTMLNNITIDLENNLVAIWHDESHLNRYFIDNPPTKILSPSYCYPESWQLPYQKRLLALDKNHTEIRQ